MKYGYSYRQLKQERRSGRRRHRRSLAGRMVRMALAAVLLTAAAAALLALLRHPPEPSEALALNRPAAAEPSAGSPELPQESEPLEGPLYGPFLPPEFERNRVSFIVSPGDTLSALLDSSGVQPDEVRRLLAALGTQTNVDRVPLGAKMLLVLDGNKVPKEFSYEPLPLRLYRGLRGAQGWQVALREVPLDLREAEVTGTIRGSLFETLQELSERAELAVGLANLFAWEIDFSRQSRPGDTFRLIVEKRFRDGKFWDYGSILAAEYRGRASGTHKAYCFLAEEGARRACYDGEGRSLRRAFLRAPLEFSRISSRYSKKRFHPILKIFRPHEGVDYAASVGTPVWSVADGRVEFLGYKGGNGKMVTIRHPNGYLTYYNHLSRYARGLRRGARVKQRQVLGYVGSTGLSTGPHLDYRIKYRGRFLDPLTVDLPPGDPVPASMRGEFFAYRDLMAARLASIDALAQATPEQPDSGT